MAKPKDETRADASKGGGDVAKIAADFLKDLPAEAKSGFYRATTTDRFATEYVDADFANGDFRDGGWSFRFEGGRFIKAIRDDVNPDLPKQPPAPAPAPKVVA